MQGCPRVIKQNSSSTVQKSAIQDTPHLVIHASTRTRLPGAGRNWPGRTEAKGFIGQGYRRELAEEKAPAQASSDDTKGSELGHAFGAVRCGCRVRRTNTRVRSRVGR